MKVFNFFGLVLLLALPTTVFGQVGFPTTPSQQEIKVTENLFAYYPFSSNANDASSNGSNATVSGATLTTDRFGTSNTAYLFDGVDDKLSGSLNMTFNNDSISMAVWVYIPNNTATTYPRIIELADGTSTDFARLMYVTAETDYRYFISKLADPDTLNVDAVIGEWRHLVGTYDPQTQIMSMYVDGIFIDSTLTGGGDIGNLTNFVIGNNLDDNRPFNGKIDELRIYNSVLTQNEINALYANYHAPKTLSATGSDQQVELRWSSERIGGLSKYYIFRDGSLRDSVSVSSVNDTTFIDTGLTNQTAYQYYITSRDTLGNISQFSDSVTAVYYESQTALTEVRPIAARVGDGIEIYGSRFSLDGSDIVSIDGEQVVTDLVVSKNKITATLTNALSPGYVDVAISGINGTDTLSSALFVIEPSNINFGLQQNVPTGSSEGSKGIDVGDLDGDGYVDIVAAHENSNQVTWYRNDQNGGYGSGTVLAAIVPQDVRIADFDNDGDLDIVYGQFASFGRVGWFKNDGSGNFSSQVEIGQLPQIRDINVADLDGDGYLDILAASADASDDPAIAWFRNNRDGTFESEERVIEERTDLPTTKIHAEDIDGDGDLDILSPIYDQTGGYFWYINNGQGNFSSRQELGISYDYPWAVETGDIDGDGFPDLITNEISGEKRTRWYRNNGSGGFITPGTEITLDSLSIVDLLTVDIDGDGDLDILAADPNGKKVIRFMNDGVGNFTQFTVTDAAFGARNVVVGDVDNDGDLDIYSVSENDHKVSWYENRLPASITAIEPSFAHPGDTLTLFGNIFDTEGSNTVTIAGETASIVSVIDQTKMTIQIPSALGAGVYKVEVTNDNGTFSKTDGVTVLRLTTTQFKNGISLGTSAGASSVRLADFDGDSDLDVLATSLVFDEVFWFRNDGDQFVEEVIYTETQGIWDSEVGDLDSEVGDLDGDGDQDFIYTVRSQDRVVWRENDGSGNFTERVISSIDKDGPRDLQLADLNGDGFLDIIVAYEFANTITWYQNNGLGTFTEVENLTTSALTVVSITATDLDNDGDIDVMSASSGDKTISHFLNDGSGSFESRQPVVSNIEGASNVLMADLNGDGIKDLLTTSPTNNELYAFTGGLAQVGSNLILGYVNRRVIYNSTNIPRQIIATDFDGDDDVDLLLAANTTDLVLFENDGTGEFDITTIVNSASKVWDIVAGDSDSDGDMDIFLADYSTGNISLFENNVDPEISEVFPKSGIIGTEVTIFGSGFSITNQDQVYFNGVQANVLESSFNRLLVQVPTVDVDTAAIFIDGENGEYTLTEKFEVISPNTVNFTQQNSISQSPSLGYFALDIADINGDGYLDWIYGDYDFSRISWHRNLQNNTFVQQQNISISESGIKDLHVADIDKDGKPDIVFINELEGGLVGWLQNNGGSYSGDGVGWTRQVITNSGTNETQRVHVADLDSDGYLDIISTSSQEGIAWFRNNQDSTFSSLIQIDTQTNIPGAEQIEAADIDNDGDLDIIVTSDYPNLNAPVWYENLGEGAFSSQNQFQVTTPFDFTFALAVTDVNKDGYIDVIVSERGGNPRLVWFANQGNKTFSNEQLITADSIFVENIEPIDLDGDGDIDLIVTDAVNDAIYYYANDGSTNFSRTTVTLFTDGASRAIPADLDNDGDYDLVSTSYLDGRLAWYENTIELRVSSFTPKSGVPGNRITLYGTGFSQTNDDTVFIGGLEANIVEQNFERMVVDIPGVSFGLKDISIQGEFGSKNLTEQINVLQPSSVNFKRQNVIDDGIYSYLEIVDINNDGYEDLITGNLSGSLDIYYNNQNKTYTAQNISSNDPITIRTADIDKDGDLDLIYANATSVSYRLNTAGSFPSQISLTGSSNIRSLEIFDFDGDGNLDILISELGSISWYKNNFIGPSTIYFEGPVSIDTIDDLGFSSVSPVLQTADIDNDGKIDIIGSTSFSSSIESILFWYKNLGDGEYESREILFNTTGLNALNNFIVTDINNDQLVDLVYSIANGSNSGQTFWHQNLGNGLFDAQVALSSSLERATNFYDIDLNGDGNVDLISIDQASDNAYYFENDGSNSFTRKIITGQLRTAGSGLPIVKPTDIDRDGDLDIVSIDSNGKLAWYENDTELRISEIKPEFGAPGSTLSLFGTGFSSTTTDSVYLGDIAANVIATSFNQLEIEVPAVAPNKYTLSVEGDNGSDTLSVPVTVLSNREIDFEIEDEIVSDPSSGAYIIKSFDVDGATDKLEDLIVANRTSGSIVWYRNTNLFQDGFEASATEIAAPGTLSDVVYLEILDLDKDGDFDIVYAQSNSTGDIGWFENTDGSAFASDQKLIIGEFSGQPLNDLEIIDLNEDGNLDFLVARENSQLGWYQNNGDLTFGHFNQINSLTSMLNVESDDFDNDGDLDIVSIHSANGSVYAFENLGKGAFFVQNEVTVNLGTSSTEKSALGVSDLNGDGLVDIIVGESTGEKATLWFNNLGNFSFDSSPNLVTSLEFSIVEMDILDLDGDGDQDILAAAYSENSIIRFMNDGAGLFTTRLLSSNAIGARSVHAAYFDLDYDLDVVSVSETDGKVAWYENQSNKTPEVLITFTDGVSDTTSRNDLRFEWSAADGDGNLSSYDVQLVGPTSIDSTITDTTITILQTGTLLEGDYIFRVRAEDNLGAKSNWTAFDFTLINTLPIIIFTASPTNGDTLITSDVLFSWDSGDLDSLGMVVNHQVELTGPVEYQLEVSDTLVVLSDLTDGDYVFTVYAVDERGGESVILQSIFSIDLPPSKPTNLIAANPIFYNRVTLQWDRLAVADVDSFTVYRGTDENILDSLVKVLNPTSGFAMYVDETVNAFTSYFYAVRAQDSFGTVSEFSDTLAVQVPRPPFTAPGNFNAISEVGRNVLNWIAPPGETIDIAQYRIYRSIEEANDYNLLATVLGTSNSYNDETIENGLTYKYFIQALAVNTAESFPTDTLSLTALFPTITDITMRAAVGDTITIFGNGLTNGSNSTTVTINGDNATIASLDSNQVQVIVPSSVQFVNQVKLTVDGQYGYTSPQSFRIINSNQAWFSTPLEIDIGIAINNLDSYDLNDDGIEDLTYINIINQLFYSNNSSLESGLGDPSEISLLRQFSILSPISLTATSAYPEFISTSNNNQVIILRNEGNIVGDRYDYVSSLIPTSLINPTHVYKGDINKDGRLDIVLVDKTNGNIGYIANKSTNDSLIFGNETSLYSVGSLTDLHSMDINNDGYWDFVVSDESNAIKVYFNISGGFFETNVVSNVTGLHDFQVADVTNDGFEDVIIIANNSASGTVTIYENNGNAAFRALSNEFSLAAPIANISLTDFDGDGKLDVLASTQNDGDLFIALNTGSSFGSPVEIFTGDFTSTEFVIMDIDFDGKPDIITYTAGSSQIEIYRNIEQKPFTISEVSTTHDSLLASGGDKAEVSLIFNEKLDISKSQLEFVFAGDFLFQNVEGIGEYVITNFSATDSAITFTSDQLYSNESVRFGINSKILFTNSNGEFYLDKNNNKIYDGASDNDTTDVFDVALIGDFDLDGKVSFEDIMFLRDAWNSEDYQFELAPTMVRSGGSFPNYRVAGDNKYDIEDIFTFIQFWNYSQSKSSKKDIPANVVAEINTDIPKKTKDSEAGIVVEKRIATVQFDSEGGISTVAFDLINEHQKIVKGMSLEISYDPKLLEFSQVIDTELFGVNNGNTIHLNYADTARGILNIQVINFGDTTVTVGRTISSLEFIAKQAKGSQLSILSDVRFENGSKLVDRVTSIIEEEDLVPQEFKLFQNYPNPFNPSTTIQYTITEKTKVVLSIYTVTGQKVMDLINTEQNPGYYTLRWDGRRYASGMYIYLLRAGNKVSSKKMLLIK